MNKKLAAFLTAHGFTVEKSVARGTYKGFDAAMGISMWDPMTNLQINFYATDDKKQMILATIKNLAPKNIVCSSAFFGATIAFKTITYGSLVKQLGLIFDRIFDILTESEAKGSEFCPICGNQLVPDKTKTCKIGYGTAKIDEDCIGKINGQINAENADFANAPNNYLKGFLGAFIGALAGAAVSVLLNVVGFVSSISAIIAILLGAFLYQKLGGKPNKMMIVIVTLTTMVLLAATIPAIYIVAAGMAANEQGLAYTAIEAFRICMLDSEFSRMFYGDIALVLLFSAIGTGFEIFYLVKKIKRDKPFETIE